MKKIGWIGTGIMGGSMCRRLQEAGYELSVYTRSREKAEALLSAGATWCDTPREVAKRSECVFTMVGYPADVEEVILGDQGVLAGFADTATDGASENAPVLVDMTTSKPALAEEIAREAAAQGVGALDAPVSGGDVGAREGTLAIMVGGEKSVYDRVLPLFEVMGKTIRLMGPAGAGQHTKMVNQVLVAGGMVGAVESLLYAARAGLDQDEVISVVGKGAAGSWTINNLGPRIAKGNMEPGFMIRHLVKDMEIALDEARRLGISLPGLGLINQFYHAAIAEGLDRKGTQALYRVYQRLNGIEP